MAAELSPMMRQYTELKAQHKDHILFFRLGDFYEMFFEDALTAARELELVLTGRDCGQGERAPMCGVPFHACEAYIARLIKKGYKVAVCEQTEDPAGAKGLVRREVVRVVTPGTLIEDALLDEGVNNYIAAVYAGGGAFGFAAADISTGAAHATEAASEERLREELARFAPGEVVFNEGLFDCAPIGAFIKERLRCPAGVLADSAWQNAEARVAERFGAGADFGERPLALCALAGLLAYIADTRPSAAARLTDLDLYSGEQVMRLDLTARRNLELTQTLRGGEKRGSLLWVLDQTRTAMGRRLMRATLEQPLLRVGVINRRLDAVEELTRNAALFAASEAALSGMFDMERLITRIACRVAAPREMKSFEQTAERLPAVKAAVSHAASAYLAAVHADIDTLGDLRELFGRALADNPPAALKDGGVIRAGYNEELDRLRALVGDTQGALAAVEARERERTGIKNLKVGYNRVFGYYLEASKSTLGMVPADYIRKQTLVGGERYITEELKALEREILSAGGRAAALEQALFEELRARVAERLPDIQRTAGAVARLDVFLSLAKVAVEAGYCRPELSLTGEIDIAEGRHPVVEALLTGEPFVPNDLSLNTRDRRILMITGPNMAGKSTYIRQAALIVLMAQIGSFVPAKSARIGLVDGIYTRVGASDDLATGQSTFMVEMREVAAILASATARSLIILDEVGRGTSTFDGMSIARATVEYIADPKKLGAKALFATHYHELTQLEQALDCVKNCHTAVKKRGDDITFLRRMVPGGADDSYGIEVSKLAGIPDWIVARAKEILSSLEAGAPVQRRGRPRAEAEADPQLRLGGGDDALRQELARVDPNTLTPIEAMNLIYKLKSMS